MRKLLAAFSLLVLCPSTAVVAQKNIWPITEAETVIAVYVDDWRLAAGPPSLVVAVWGDGQIVWSENQISGGPPYYIGQVSPNAVGGVIGRMSRDGVFAIDDLNQPRAPNDSRFTVVLIRSANQQLKMQSAHELDENNGGGSEGRLVALANESARHLFYRMVWAETRLRVGRLIPSKSSPSRGEFIMKKGIVSWVEDR